MLYVKDKVVKLGGVYIGGMVTAVEITAAANIHTIQDDKGKIKKTQPSGYEQAKVTIDLLLEDTKTQTSLEQLKDIKRLFKGNKQENAKILNIVNQDCAACGISKVYFKSLRTKKVTSESKRIVSMELISPRTAGIKVKKNTSENGLVKLLRVKEELVKLPLKSNSQKYKEFSPAVDTPPKNVIVLKELVL